MNTTWCYARAHGPSHRCVDLADEVHRALGAAGIESYVVTAGPMAAAQAAGEDASEADVVQDLGMCAGIKRKARHRPVVMITRAKDERRVCAHMRGASGPDAHVVWPASGEDLRAAVARAVAVAGATRPRFPRRRVLSTIAAAIGAILIMGGPVLRMLDMRLPSDTATAVGQGLFGAGFWMGADYGAIPVWDRIAGASMLVLAAVGTLLLVARLSGS